MLRSVPKMVPVSKQDLEYLIGRPLSDYVECSRRIEGEGHGCLTPAELFEMILERGVRTSLSPLSRIAEGPYQSGDVWHGAYHTIFFYLGKTPDMQDVLVELGGDSVDPGEVHVCEIGKGRYTLTERIFPL